MRKLKVMELICYAYGSAALFTPVVHAYIDPSAATYVVQAVAGVVIALGAVAGVCWRRAKRKMDEKLGIDLDKNKEVESDEV